MASTEHVAAGINTARDGGERRSDALPVFVARQSPWAYPTQAGADALRPDADVTGWALAA